MLTTEMLHNFRLLLLETMNKHIDLHHEKRSVLFVLLLLFASGRISQHVAWTQFESYYISLIMFAFVTFIVLDTFLPNKLLSIRAGIMLLVLIVWLSLVMLAFQA